MTLKEVVRLVDELSREDRAALAAHLQVKLAAAGQLPLTREALVAEHARLVASGAFASAESLLDRFARPGPDLDDEQLGALLHEIRTEWERELDEFHHQP